MKTAIAELARMIEEASGFVVSPRSYAQLAAVAMEQIAALKLVDIEEFMDLLSVRPDSPEWRHLLARITVKESFMYRGRAQFDALSSTILDELAAIRPDRRLRIWCAGCARGEEAVTLAIVLASHPGVGSWEWSILATDVDDQALVEAARGSYGERAVAAVPADVLASRFVRREDRYEVDPGLLSRITYRRLNLIDRDAVLARGPFDVVFLRNVLIYFRPELQRQVVKTVESALSPGGVLFLGPSESLLPLEASLTPRDLGSCFCYQWPSPLTDRRQPAGSSRFTGTGGAANDSTPVPAIPRLATADGSDRSSADERIALLLEKMRAGDLEKARGLALALRHEFPELPVAHALVGLTASRASEHGAAILAFRAALYLDPELPEIRYLLATALEEDGRSDRALREYRSVLAALGAAPSAPSQIFRAFGVPGRDEIGFKCRKKIIEIKS